MTLAIYVVVFFILRFIELNVGFSIIIAALLGMLLHADGRIDPVMVPNTLVSSVDSRALVA